MLFVDSGDHAGVLRAAGDLRDDIARVTACNAVVVRDGNAHSPNPVIVGTIGKNRILDGLIRAGKFDASLLAGKWESFIVQVVPDPFPGTPRALVIAGSDKRGTIYGIYDLSEQIGVSPWHWWADVPVRHRDALFVSPGKHFQDEPAVKYRGIFLNDEAPSLSGWTNEKNGGFNSRFYVRVFELILRLKGNYLWPAMWGNAFNEDDPLNPKLADEYGIVMGNSHHEPMLRAQQEWKRHGTGPWNYATNADVLRKFWTEGIRRNKDFESIVSIGMRGDGDLPMVEGGDMAANVALLEKIVADQRDILAQYINPQIDRVPQLWALYKEVQEYYDKGMRVPGDVTLLWCDDNWGNVRRLPTPEERSRPGGAGIYYHFDYVGGPRNYKWLNTVPITKVWEQMTLAYEYDARRIWIVNVGDLKPMEFPIEFFLTLAWNPPAWPQDRIAEFSRLWAERDFGREHATEIAGIVAGYTKLNGRRKPELLDSVRYSLVDYQEADRVLADWRSLTARAEKISATLPPNARDAFFQLVLYPTKASAQVNELYIAAMRNRLYASQGRAAANDLADQVRTWFQADADLSAYYNHKMAGGKWNHMMDQTHIGYTYWQQPPENTMPAVTRIELPAEAKMGVSVEGSTSAWPGSTDDPVLPEFDSFQRERHYIDIFNRGRAGFDFNATSSDAWIVLSKSAGRIEKEERIWVDVDWSKAPQGSSQGSVKIAGIVVKVPLFNPSQPPRESLTGFVEAGGVVSVEAAHYTHKVDATLARWELIPDYGRTLSSMTIFPMTAASANPPSGSPCLEYRMYLFHPGRTVVHAILAPTLNFVPGRGLRYAVSFDDQTPQIVDALTNNSLKDWEESVKDSVRDIQSIHTLAGPGYHVLKFWMVDPGVVLQKLVVDCGGVRPSYLGPPESYHQ